VAVQLPIGAESDFTGMVDLISMKAIYFDDEQGKEARYADIPSDLLDKANKMRGEMVEKAAEQDDQLIAKYLDGIELTPEDIKTGLRKGVLSGKLAPVLCGSSLKNKGVQPLLDAVIDYLPSPLDVPPVTGIHPHTKEEVIRTTDDGQPLSALVFKIVSDPYVGRLAYIRVYSGKITQGSTVQNSSKERKERIGRLIRMYADRREDITDVYAGDIGAILGLKESFTGDTLCDPSNPIVLEDITFPEPVISVAIEPKTTADQEKMGEALKKLSEEDPTFRVHSDETTSQTIISGMGELHLDVLVDRMLREFKVQANVGKPRVAYRETITRPVTKVPYRYIKQSGGRGMYGHVVFDVEPLERGKGVVFENKVFGGSVPKEYIPAIEKGVMEAAETGVLAGFAMTDLKVTLTDGSYHEVDSNEMAFKMAAIFAFKEAVGKGSPVMLEPIMKVEVLVPEEYIGDILGQINSRRGSIQGMEMRPGKAQALNATVPLAEMFGYATELRSGTQGRGVFTMEFDHYAPVPASVAQNISGS
jgi:elongation factor G